MVPQKLLELADVPQWADWSITRLEDCSLQGPLVINPLILAEISPRFERVIDLEAALDTNMQNYLHAPTPFCDGARTIFHSLESPMQIIVEVPKNYLDAMHLTSDDFAQEAKLAMAAKLFEMKRLSSGMAASLIGMDRVTFLAQLQRFGVPMIDFDADELAQDILNA